MAASPTPTQTLQGIEVPAANVDPASFFKATRRQFILQDTRTIQGPGLTDTISVLASGIISGFQLKFSGSLVLTLNSGTVASSPRWPYDFAKAVRFSANGQSNLINCSGAKLKARQIMSRGSLTDRGVSRGISGASPGTATTQGTMSLNSENWGVGSNVTAIAGGTYDVELEWFWNRAQAEMGMRSGFESQLGVRAPHAGAPAPDEVVDAAHAYRQIERWLERVLPLHVAVLKAAYEACPWPTPLYDELGRLTGIAVRLACVYAGETCPEDEPSLRRVLLTRAAVLSAECERCRAVHVAPLVALRRGAEKYFAHAQHAYARARGKGPCVVKPIGRSS